MELQTVVDEGADAITEEFGSENWVDQIDLDSLNLGNIFDCVLGQLYGVYLKAPDSLYDRREELGFSAKSNPDLYPLLTGLWARKIREIKKTREMQA